MPASEAQDVRRGRLLQGFFWSGVGVATLAMLALLFSQSLFVLRLAVILSVIAIMLLAVSIVLRPSVEMVRVDIEEHIIGEVERVRLRAREDISTAARNTHRVLTEKIYALTATVEALRAQIEEVRAGSMLGGEGPSPYIGQPPPPPGVGAGVGVVHRTETVQVTRRTTTVDPGDEATRGTVYGSRSAVDGEWSDERGEGGGTRSRGAGEGDRPSSRPQDGYGEADWEATFRSLSRQQSALPPSPGRPASWYTDDRPDDERARSRGRGREPHRERDRDPEDGRHREHHHERDYDRDMDYDRGKDHDRGRDDERDRSYGRDSHDPYRDPAFERYRDRERGRERPRDHERHHDHDWYRERARDFDRERGYEAERGYDREREYDRPRDRDRGYDGDPDEYGRGHDHPGERTVPRPRSPHPAERER